MGQIGGAVTPTDDEVRHLIDSAAARAVVEGYMTAVDRCDYPGIAACFTDDAKLNYDVEPYVFTGGHEVAEWMRSFDHLPVHTHTVSNCAIEIDGDQAHADTFGFAVLVVGASGPGSILVVGLRYVDALVRTEQGWRISQRKHTLTWQYQASAEPVALKF